MSRPVWFVSTSLGTAPLAIPDWSDQAAWVRGVKTSRGRQQALDVVQPGTATVTIDDTTRRFDPFNDDSPLAGYLLPGRRMSVAAAFGSTGLVFPIAFGGGYAANTQFDDLGWLPGGAMDIRIDLASADWTPPDDRILVGQFDDAYTDFGWAVALETTGDLIFYWSTDGTVGGILAASVALPGWSDATRHHLRVTFSPSREIKFFETTTDGFAWDQIGSTVTGAATTVHPSTADIRIGYAPGSTLVGTVFSFTLLDGIDGDVLLNPRFTNGEQFPPDTGAGVDGVGRTWKIGAPASITPRVSPVFGGFVEGWPVARRALASTPIQMTDGFAILAQSTLPGKSPYEAVVTSTRPTHWYRLDEPAGSLVVNDVGSRPHNGDPNSYAAAGLGSPGLDPGAATNATALANVDHGFVEIGPGDTWTVIAVLVQRPAAMGTADETIYHCGGGRLRELVILGSASGHVGRVQASDDTDSMRTYSQRVDDGDPHLIIVVRTAPGVFDFWIDGANPSTSAGMGLESPTSNAYIGAPNALGSGSWEGTIQHLAMWNRFLTSDELFALAQAAIAWSDDTTDERVGRILDFAGWSTGERDLAASDIAALGPGSAGTNALEDIRQLERTEGGMFFQQADYVLRFTSRYSAAFDPRSANVRYTFTDVDNIPGAFRFSDIALAEQGQWIRNRVTVTYVGGEVTVDDPVSIATYEVRSHSVATVLTDATRAHALASLILSRFAWPVVRVSRLVLDCAADPALWEPALDLEIGDRVRVVWTPANTGTQIDVQCLVDGIALEAGDGVNVGRCEMWLSTADLAVDDSGTETFVWDVSTWDETTIWAR